MMKTLLTIATIFMTGLSFAQSDTLPKSQSLNNTDSTKTDTTRTLVVRKPEANPDRAKTLTEIKARSEKVKKNTARKYKGKKVR